MTTWFYYVTVDTSMYVLNMYLYLYLYLVLKYFFHNVLVLVLKVHYLTNTLYLYLSTFLEYLRHHCVEVQWDRRRNKRTKPYMYTTTYNVQGHHSTTAKAFTYVTLSLSSIMLKAENFKRF